MREAVIDRLHAEFGDPVSETPTAFCWHLGEGFDVIAEKDSIAHLGVVWVPAGTLDPAPALSEGYEGRSDRHEGTYNPRCPSLAKGRPALRIVLHWHEELDAMVRGICGFVRQNRLRIPE
jgi:hypothetical protein